MLRKQLCIALCMLFTLTSALAADREEIRGAYAKIVSESSGEVMFAAEPDIVHFGSIGSLSEDKTENALAYVNFLRTLAGLDPVRINELYTIRAQHAACLLAANDELSHAPERYSGMSEGMYQTAFAGAQASNLACLSWTRPQILLECISYFERDDGANNEGILPHRRWLLNPEMSETGFGLAVSGSGRSYMAMYAVDSGNADVDWDYVAWPAEGIFPAELMREDLPWSVSLCDDIYDPELSRPEITLTEENSGERFFFSVAKDTRDGDVYLSTEPYGSGWCLIFTPDLRGRNVAGYEQNQHWRVIITGLYTKDGQQTRIEYECDMISLSRQRTVNVELYPAEVSLQAGEQTNLSANVIPAYADDLTVEWICDNETIASVDRNGTVTGIAKGTCTVTARTADGAWDTCTITVR